MCRCRQRSRIYTILIALIVALMARPAAVLAQPGGDVRINTVDVVPISGEVRHAVQAFVSVADAEGQPIRGLSAAAFTVTEDGIAVRDVSVKAADPKISLVLVIDTSGSMTFADSGTTPVAEIRKAAIALVDHLQEGDELALITFATDVINREDFTRDHNRVINTLNTIEPEGWTCLFDGAYRALEKAAQRPQGRRALLVFTDGFDEGIGNQPCSVRTLDEVIDKANNPGVQTPIYTVGLKSNAVAVSGLTKMAESTGGRTAIAPRSTDLENLFVGIAQQLKSQYLVEYRTAAPAGPHQITVKVDARGSTLDSQLRTFELGSIGPAVQVVNPQAGASIAGDLQVAVEVKSQCALSFVRAELAGEIIKEIREDRRSWSFEIKGTDYDTGNYTLNVIAEDCSQLRGESSLAFTWIPITPTPTPTVTPTRGPDVTPTHSAIPRITHPSARATVNPGPLVLRWEFAENLGRDEEFEIRLSRDGQQLEPYRTRDKELQIQIDEGRYEVSVAAVRLGDDGRWADASGVSPSLAIATKRRDNPTALLLGLLVMVAGGALGGVLYVRSRRKTSEMTVVPTWPPRSDWDDVIGGSAGVRPTPGLSGGHEGITDDVGGKEGVTQDVGGGYGSPAVVANLRVERSLDTPRGQVFELQRRSYKIGRSTKEGNDIVIADQPVSRKHAEIYYDGSSFRVTDSGSSLGTFVNGTRLASGQSRSLDDGDALQLGTQTVLRIQYVKDIDDITHDVGGLDVDVTRDVGDRDSTQDIGGPYPQPSWTDSAPSHGDLPDHDQTEDLGSVEQPPDSQIERDAYEQDGTPRDIPDDVRRLLGLGGQAADDDADRTT